MHLLMIEDRPGIAASSTSALERAGHQVHRCHEGTGSFPCRGLTGGCPLEGPQPIDLVVDVRCGTDAAATASEAGGTCALRRGVPVLVDGRTDPFPGWAAVRREDEDLLPACERALADHDRARSAPIQIEVDRLLEVHAPGSGPSTVRFGRTTMGTSIQVEVPVSVSPSFAGTIAARVHAIERARGAGHRVLDIGVTGPEPA
ncbi:hypothetical protein [Aquihabitans sp. McL0605]|uniref:hypothetical protein n=1 Tax=Aquihabitans sp. McL0605 TaxID=3415671 RepID=UPI003CF1059F